jgi:FtsZ-interacting cell division protein YlmF
MDAFMRMAMEDGEGAGDDVMGALSGLSGILGGNGVLGANGMGFGLATDLMAEPREEIDP